MVPESHGGDDIVDLAFSRTKLRSFSRARCPSRTKGWGCGPESHEDRPSMAAQSQLQVIIRSLSSIGY